MILQFPALPFDEVALIVVVPLEIAFTTPFESTLATDGLLVEKVIVLSVALLGTIDTDKVILCPTLKVLLFGEIFTPETRKIKCIRCIEKYLYNF